MLEHVPLWLGESMRGIRAGHAKLVIADPDIGVSRPTIQLASLAFGDGDRLPERFTADGAGVSPPLHWSGVPGDARALALVVEDPDAPALHPLVHAILWNIAPDSTQIAEGAIRPDGEGGDEGNVGRNSFLREGWLPPDPPSGHGEHDYVFQLFALSDAAELGPNPGRGAIVKAMAGRVLAAGLLVGTYSRGQAVPIGADAVGSGAATT